MNYYEILRVPSTATLIEIKKSYKRLVKRYHPDIYEGNKLFAEYKIKEINEAYDVLKSSNSKAIYDAELEHKKYQAQKSDFVKTYTKSDIDKYQNAYNKKEKVKENYEKSKIKISLNSIIKKYFKKVDEYYQTEDKQNFIIYVLISLIMVFSIDIIGFLF